MKQLAAVRDVKRPGKKQGTVDAGASEEGGAKDGQSRSDILLPKNMPTSSQGVGFCLHTRMTGEVLINGWLVTDSHIILFARNR